MTFAISIIFILFSLLLLVYGLRGRRIDDHPLCRKCRFDLFNLPGRTQSCPECGADITTAGAVLHGNRRRRPRVAALGGLLLLFSSGVLGVGLWARSTQFNWNTIKPVWWLQSEMHANDSNRADAALSELVRRLDDGNLAPASVDEIATFILDAHGNDQTWSTRRAATLQRLITRGDLSDEQIVRLAKQMLLPTLTMRPRVRQGDTTVIAITIDRHHPPDDCELDLQVYGASITIDGDEHLRGRGGGTSSLCAITGSFGTHITVDRPPGTYPVTGTWELTLRGREDDKQYLQWQVELDGQLQVVDAQGDDISYVHNAQLDQQMRERIRAQQATVTGGESIYCSGMIQFNSLPVAAAFEVYWQVGEQELRVGEVWSAANKGRVGMGYSASVDHDLDGVETVTVILRPSGDIARRTPDLLEIWGGEIIFEDQPVTHIRAAN